MNDPSQAPWGHPPARWNHFVKHGREVGAATEDEYDASARETIRRGKRFAYQDRHSGAPRVGYYEQARGHFTAMNAAETRIVTHFSMSERQVRSLPLSDYR